LSANILSNIEKSVPLIVELETLLCAIPAMAPESDGEGELKKCEALESWLKKHGVNQLERHDAPDTRVPSGIRPNLVATIPGESDSKRLWIMSHLDVVPPGDLSMWTSDPWTVVQKDGKLYGRGVEDNQQGLVAATVAALALLENGVKPPHTVKILFVADEEVGSAMGIQWLLANRNLFRADDMVLIPDGGNRDGSIMEVAEKNLIWLKIHTKGVQCHGSMPDLGANAHLAAAELAVRLHDELQLAFPIHDPLFDPDRSTFEPTKSEANVPNINSIPGDDVFYMDMRILPRYPIKQVMAEIDRIIAEVEKKRKVTISHEAVQSVESKSTSPDAPVVKSLATAIKTVYGVDPSPIGIGGGTVGAYLRNAGVDSVVWSRLDESAHQPNEYAVIDNIVGDAKVMALLMLEKRSIEKR